MKDIVYKLRHFLIVVIAFVFFAVLILSFTDKLELHLQINQFHSDLTDFFFRNATHIGDGAFALILLPYLLFFTSFRVFIISVLACLLSGLLVQFLKKVVFSDHLRPTALIDISKLHIVEGVHLNTMYSFPSGHTTSAFAFFILLAFYMKSNKIAHILFALCAIVVGFSRIYLSQHFLVDVSVGAILGTSGFFVAYYIVEKMNYAWLDKKPVSLLR